ncbi:hypothetical protein OsJ_22294 [Oryza sativa Japonica Group]|uniref:MADS-box domain-containing protein n=1 Tax=Oryza sativa subsp. japonica TaxID=39947 RepID=B9FQE1_ORYSJ|nr:hypothetical protein OsJ_22294 [Oryza sativa Japonica Group]
MGQGKIEMKRIEDATRRQVTFSKRRAGFLKKANELAVLCDAQVGVVVFSDKGKLFDFCSPPVILMELFHRYEITTRNTRLQETNRDDEQMVMEITRLRNEIDQLEASLRRQTGEDLSSVSTVDELSQLQLQLESSLSKVHARKDELMSQQLEDMRRMVHYSLIVVAVVVFADEWGELQLWSSLPVGEQQMSENWHSENWQSPGSGEASAMEALTMLPPAAAATTAAEAFNCFFPEEEKGVAASSTLLQLWPQPHDGDQPDLRLW